MKLNYLPNIITGFRLLLIFPFMYTLLDGEYIWTFYIFFFAGLSDGLDGYIARHYHWESQLGGFLDPLADKLFVACSFITLAYLGKLPWWLVSLVFTRDVAITVSVVLWQYFFGYLKFQPTTLSKTNTVIQGFVVLMVLFEMAYFNVPRLLFYTMIITITTTTSASFVHYGYLAFLRTKEKLKEYRSKKNATSSRH